MLNEPGMTQNNKWKTAFWCVFVCLVVAVIVIIFTSTKSLSEYNSLVDKYNELVTQKLSIDAEVDTYSKQITDLQKHAADSENQINELKNEVSELKKQLKDSKYTLYDAIKNFTPERQYKDFFASAEVLVVKKGEKETINIFLDHQGTVEWEWYDERISIGYRYGDWRYDKAIPYLPIDIEGIKAGVDTYTFKNTANTEKIKVLVVVID